jgi:F-type H+-transporting ATPase subunit a
MATSPLTTEVVFSIGPVPFSRAVVTTWAIMAVLTLVSWLGLRRARAHAGGFQMALEIVVETLERQIAEIIRRDTSRYLPLLGTLFVFLVCANLSIIVPGAKPPTAHLETPAALAILVFVSVHYFGIRSRGVLPYLRRYVRPNPLLLPLNLLSEITRTFSLMVRLFGNIMSHELVIGVVVLLVGLLLPVPFMVLSILIGIIQAYIFTVLAAVFIGAAVDTTQAE